MDASSFVISLILASVVPSDMYESSSENLSSGNSFIVKAAIPFSTHSRGLIIFSIKSNVGIFINSDMGKLCLIVLIPINRSSMGFVIPFNTSRAVHSFTTGSKA
uniref:Uncharacterized protein n=1 Tax=Cacopsylla melanoneura TaxID=428564 RepID=A0A8D9AP71_9HEMI